MNEKNPSRSIVQAFVEVANTYPSNVAVAQKFSDHWVEISYTELLEQAQNVAAQLFELGVKEGDAIIVPAIRGPNLCSHLLGILWAGASYVFVDPDFPPERQQFICREVGASIGIIDDNAGPIETLPLDWLRVKAGNLPPPPVPTNEMLPAYIMFTSGSTGTPKGVVVPHLGVYRLVRDTDYIDFAQTQIFLQLSAVGFGLSTLELWGPLVNGGTSRTSGVNSTENYPCIS